MNEAKNRRADATDRANREISAAPRTRIALLTTGGTIAGESADPTDPGNYTAGVRSGDALLASIPCASSIADITVEPCLALDSKDMQPGHWLQIAKALRSLLARSDVDGVVVTHGTDTLEETAMFLGLTVAADKPVVITGAMRPATAISSDGPANLIDALRVAAAPESRGRGVLVSFAESIFSARDVRKRHANLLDAFSAASGAIGATRPSIRYFHPPRSSADTLSILTSTLPEVAILHLAAGTAPTLAEAAVSLGARGLVLALTGNGSVPQSWESVIADIVGQGIPVVRASRCGDSHIGPREPDISMGTWPAGILSPATARVALIAALATTDGNNAETEALFRRIGGATGEVGPHS